MKLVFFLFATTFLVVFSDTSEAMPRVTLKACETYKELAVRNIRNHSTVLLGYLNSGNFYWLQVAAVNSSFLLGLKDDQNNWFFMQMSESNKLKIVLSKYPTTIAESDRRVFEFKYKNNEALLYNVATKSYIQVTGRKIPIIGLTKNPEDALKFCVRFQ